MGKRQTSLQNERPATFARRLLTRILWVVNLVFLLAITAPAIPISDYHNHVRQAVTSLDTLAQADETESVNGYAARDAETVRRVRKLLPPSETVEVKGASINVDNSWLHQELDQYAADTSLERYDSLKRITERLQGLSERLEELEKPVIAGASKAEGDRKLAEILKRPESAHQAEQENALSRLYKRLLKWIKSLFPEPKPMSPGRAGVVSRVAQWVVIILALGVLVYVLTLFLPRLFKNRQPKKKRKEKARIVLGETLAADQSALDLLAEAEALARRGELRAAIRRAYIALLVELGDRKILSLAQYKTNRDYLRAMREIEPLYHNVKLLTDSFERHWYGLAQADETDWLRFRSAYTQALMK